jgi:hypothetical protein
MAMLAVLLCVLPLFQEPVQAPEAAPAPEAPALVPLDVVATVWVPSPSRLVDGIVGDAGLLHGFMESPLWTEMEALPGWPMVQFAWQRVLDPVDGEVEAFLDAFAGDGLTLVAARRGDSPIGYGMVAAAQDADLAMECLEPLLGFAGIRAEKVEGPEWKLQLDNGAIARNGQHFAFGGSPDSAFGLAAELAVARASTEGLAVLQAAHPEALALAWVDASLTDGGESPLPEDVGASFLAADWHEALRQASWLGGTLEASAGRLTLGLEVPAAPELTATHAPFYPPAVTLQVPQLAGSMASMVLPRDLGGWWTARDAYMSEGALATTTEGDANLALLFGRDPGSEVFAQLEPEMLLLFARLPEAEAADLAVEYPAGALGLRRRADADEDLGAAFANAFLGAVLFSNFSGGAQGEEILMVDVEALPQGKLYTATYRDPAPGVLAPARHNLSPAMLFTTDGEIWLSSSTGLLREIAAAPRAPQEVDGTRIELTVAPLLELLVEQREALIARRMLEEGGDEEAAAPFIDLALQAVGLFEGVSLRSGLSEGRLRLEVETRALY